MTIIETPGAATVPAARARDVLDRAAARAFVDTRVAPFADEYDREARLPGELLTEISRAGLWAPFLPLEAGGLGLDMVTVGAIHEEVGRGCSSVRSLLTVHGMVAWAVQRWGSTTQREFWLPQLASGTTLGAFCLTEPQAGSDSSRITTRARRRGDDWILTGVKKWITGGQIAGLFLVFARTDLGVAAFLVPGDAPGVEITPVSDIMGTRASMLAEVRLDQAVAGPDALLGPDGFTAGLVMTGALDIGRYSVAAGSVGIIQACLEACAAYSSRRSVSAGRLRDLQLIRAKITDMVTDVSAGRLLCEHAGRLKDAGDKSTIMATLIAKYFASTAAARHAGEAVQIHGANGIGPGFPVGRYYRDAKVMEIIEGSSEIQRITIADEAYREAGR
jgi:alkylation response protein AidB-like acyl-CoA dehydrogenase